VLRITCTWHSTPHLRLHVGRRCSQAAAAPRCGLPLLRAAALHLKTSAAGAARALPELQAVPAAHAGGALLRPAPGQKADVRPGRPARARATCMEVRKPMGWPL